MVICYVYKNYQDGIDSGISRYLNYLVRAIGQNHKIIVLAAGGKAKFIQQGNLITVVIASWPRLELLPSFLVNLIYSWRFAMALLTLCRLHKVEIIEFANWEYAGLIWVTLFSQFFAVKHVVRMHTPVKIVNQCEDDYSPSARINEFLEKLFVQQKNIHLVSSTRVHAKRCRGVYNLIHRPIKIIPLGIPLLKPVTVKSSTESILFVGRLEQRKGINLISQIIPRLLVKHPKLEIYLVGRDTNNYLSQITNQLDKSTFSRFHYFGLVSDQKLFQTLIQSADVCVTPSLYESFGLVIIEMMRQGKAIVASRVGGIPEIIDDQKNGLLFNPKSRIDLINKIELLLENNAFKIKLGKAAYQKFRHSFEAQKMADKTLKFYAEICAN